MLVYIIISGFHLENSYEGAITAISTLRGAAKNSQCNQLTINREIISYLIPMTSRGGHKISRGAEPCLILAVYY